MGHFANKFNILIKNAAQGRGKNDLEKVIGYLPAFRTFSTIGFRQWDKKKFCKKICNISFFALSSVAAGGMIGSFVLIKYGNQLRNLLHSEWDDQWDSSWNEKKEEPDRAEGNKKIWKELILVRHGQYHMDRNETEMKLTDLGKKQAEAVGRRLAELYKGKKIGHIYHSSMIRAKQTAQIVSRYFPNVELIEDANLSEGVPAYPEPLIPSFNPTKEEVEVDKVRINNAFETYFFRPNNSNLQFDVKEDNNKIYDIIICHGNVIRYFFCRGLQFPRNAWLRLGHMNCAITTMGISSEGHVVCTGFGDNGFMVKEMMTHN